MSEARLLHAGRAGAPARVRQALLRAAATLAALVAACPAADWPTYRHDNARSGVTPEALGGKISPRWVFRALHPPSPAWSDPQPIPIEGVMEYSRVRIDDAFHVAAADGAVYFGSSSDHSVYCLAATTGALRWRFHTGGPVRLAPTVAGGRVYVGSDDGWVYCLRARDGAVVWKFRAAAGDDRVLGQGRMISLWPVRTGVMVDRKVAYFGAGLFPGEGLFLHAVNAETGKPIWRSDTAGRGGMAGLSPQGYLLCSPDRLYVLSGRAGPAMFDRATGKLILQKSLVWRRHGLFGGPEAYSRPKLKTGHAWIRGRRLVVAGPCYYVLTGTHLVCYDRKTYPAASRKQNATIAKRAEKHRRERTRRYLQGDLAKARKALAAARKSQAKKALAAATAKVAAVEKQIAAEDKRLKPIYDLEKLAAKMVHEATKWRVSCKHVDSMILAGSMLACSISQRRVNSEGAMKWPT